MAGHEKHSNEKGNVERELLVWQSSLANAKQCILRKNYGRAFAHFLLVLKLCPSMKNVLKDDFVLSMREWTECLERQGRIKDLFNCYDQACELFPECEAALNNIGAQLFRLGYTDEAALYVRRALKLCPDFLAARENLENICSHLVERWHFRMLNDMTRNRAFRDAVDLAVTQGYTTVLDIGAGTGLLSLFAEEAGATVVHACEVSKSMYEVATEVIAANCSTAEKIHLIPKLSLDLDIPQDIPDKVSLVVTETFDAGLFGEHIISTLHHAWQYLLLSPSTLQGKGGRVIPEGAAIYLCPLESDILRKQNRLLYPVLLNLDLRGIDITCRTSTEDEDPYTTESLTSLRTGYRQLAKPITAFKVNFCDPQEIAELQKGLDKMVDIKINQSGKLDAVAMWFDLDLDKNVTITTAPHVTNCWEQAIFPVLSSHFVHQQNKDDVRMNYSVKESDTLSVKCSLQNDCFRVVCKEVTRGQSKRYEDKTTYSEKGGEENKTYTFPHCEISKLNDLTLNRLYLQALEAAKQKVTSRFPVLLDLADGLSPLGLQAALIGYKDITMTTSSETVQGLLCHIADINSITRERLNFCVTKEILDADTEYDVMVVDLFESSGVLRQQVLEDLALARLTSLRKDGIILPGHVTVMGMCVESETLAKSSFVVTSEYTLGYQIADFIRDFQATTHLDIDLHTLSYKKLCEPFKMFHLDFNEYHHDSDLPAFLQQEKEVNLMVTDSGCVHAVVYWFEVQITEGIQFTTLDPSLHWKQAAKMMKGNLNVSAGQSQSFKLLLKNSCIDVSPFS